MYKQDYLTSDVHGIVHRSDNLSITHGVPLLLVCPRIKQRLDPVHIARLAGLNQIPGRGGALYKGNVTIYSIWMAALFTYRIELRGLDLHAPTCCDLSSADPPAVVPVGGDAMPSSLEGDSPRSKLNNPIYRYI